MTDRFWSEIKKDTAASLLADSAGVMVKGRKCVIIHIKSPNTIFIPIRSDAEMKLFLWGLSGTGTDRREFTSELTQFLRLFRNDVSPRDVNAALVSDFISSYLTDNLYKRSSERPLALEFILGQVSDRELSFLTIDFRGESKLWDTRDRFSIIGCPGKKRDKLQRALSGLKVGSLNAKKLAAMLRLLVREFRGDVLFSEFIIDQLEQPEDVPKINT